MRLYEKKFQPSLDNKINEFGRLSDEIDRIKNKLSELSSKYKVIENELRPLLEQLHSQNKKSIQTERYLITLKRIGYTKENFKYKQSFEKSLEKVNEQTKRILKDILQQTKTVSSVVSSIGVQRLNEDTITKMFRKLFSSYERFIRPLKRSIQSIDGLNMVLRKMVG